jgi:hypothetical protein
MFPSSAFAISARQLGDMATMLKMIKATPQQPDDLQRIDYSLWHKGEVPQMGCSRYATGWQRTSQRPFSNQVIWY